MPTEAVRITPTRWLTLADVRSVLRDAGEPLVFDVLADRLGVPPKVLASCVNRAQSVATGVRVVRGARSVPGIRPGRVRTYAYQPPDEREPRTPTIEGLEARIADLEFAMLVAGVPIPR